MILYDIENDCHLSLSQLKPLKQFVFTIDAEEHEFASEDALRNRLDKCTGVVIVHRKEREKHREKLDVERLLSLL